MASKVLYLFYSEEDFPLTKSTTPTRPKHPDNPISAELLYFPAVWFMREGVYYRLDFTSVDVARDVLGSAVFFKNVLKKHTTKVINHQEYLKAFKK